MTSSPTFQNATPIAMSTDKFSDYGDLVSFAECWQACRGDKLLAPKRDFEGTILGYPKLLPNMTMIESAPDGALNYLYIGSERTTRLNREDTGTTIIETLAPSARDFLMSWALAGFERPVASFWTQRNHLPNGEIAEDFNLSVILGDDNGAPVTIAIASVPDPVYERQSQRGGYLIGSAGVAMVPIDIGLGIPDLPMSIV